MNRHRRYDIEPSPQYSELAHAAHRRPAYSLNAPALTRHLLLRPKPDANPIGARDNRETVRRENALRRRINEMLVRAQPEAETPVRFAVGNEKADGITRLEYLDSFSCTLATTMACRLRLHVDIHSEFFTVTLLADGFDSGNAGDTHGVTQILLDLQECDCAGRAGADEIRDNFYRAFWEKVEIETRIGLGLLPAEILGDFRGFVACPPVISQALDSRGHQELELPLSGMQEQRRDSELDDALNRFVSSRPILFSSIFGLGPDDMETMADQDANVVMCGMDDGAAIYGSALGRQSPGQAGPLRYFLIYDGYSANQVGRLVHRLHGMAELRTAALMDMDGLRKASRALRVLGYDVDKATKTLSDPDETGRLNRQLTRIGHGCVGGLNYRVTRSRYYAQIYRERMQDLRIVRIEGWQAYDVFVRRNIFEDFDYVSRIGDRNDTLRERIEVLLGTGQTSQMREHVQELRDLQQFAEIVSAAAFTYYLGETLKEAAAHLQPGVVYLMQPVMSIVSWLLSGVFTDAGALGSSSFALAFAIYIVIRVLIFPVVRLLGKAYRRAKVLVLRWLWGLFSDSTP
jgi:hypothetical protein